jgi:hypothetical protein
MVLQTAASLENILASAYAAAAGLAFIQNGNATIRSFFTRTGAQHTAHARAFNAAAAQAGGLAQTAGDPRYAPAVARELAALTDAASAAGLMATLEDVAAQTYTRYVGLVADRALRALFSGTAPVEAQHRSILLVMQALVSGGAQELVALPTLPARLSGQVAAIGVPEAFYPIGDASAINEGSVA